MLFKRIVLPLTCLIAVTTYAGAGDTVVHSLVANLSWLYLKPMSNNHIFAYDVGGQQTYYQNWHAQALNPGNTSAFELGLQYAMQENRYNLSGDWIHLSSSTTASKHGNDTLDLKNIEFVAPSFEMSPPVFGIRYVDSKLNYNYDDMTFNLEKVFKPYNWLRSKIVAGINVLYIKQNITTTFSDYVGSLPTPYSYALPPDPSYSFQIQSISQFVGSGPDIGISGQLEFIPGFSIVGAAFGSLNVGTTSVQETFTATSQVLTNLGIGVSKQAITVPNKTQVVPGFDGKLGLQYQFQSAYFSNFSLEGGYRIVTYINAISTINPQTLVQPGSFNETPEFATGTMAIVSISQQDRPFNLNGPYVTLKINFL